MSVNDTDTTALAKVERTVKVANENRETIVAAITAALGLLPILLAIIEAARLFLEGPEALRTFKERVRTGQWLDLETEEPVPETAPRARKGRAGAKRWTKAERKAARAAGEPEPCKGGCGAMLPTAQVRQSGATCAECKAGRAARKAAKLAEAEAEAHGKAAGPKLPKGRRGGGERIECRTCGTEFLGCDGDAACSKECETIWKNARQAVYRRQRPGGTMNPGEHKDDETVARFVRVHQATGEYPTA